MQKNDWDALLEKYEELHDLLCEYDQEEWFFMQIQSAIQEAVNQLPEGIKVGFRPYGDPTRWMVRNIDFTHAKITGIFDKEVTLVSQSIPVYKVGSEKAQDVDVFIMTSFNQRREIMSELEREQHRVLDIYQVLEEKGMQLYAPIHHYIKGCPAVLHNYLMKWKHAKGKSHEEAAFRNLLIAACEAKDFVMLEDLLHSGDKYAFIKSVREKYDAFHELFINLLEKRNQRDIVLYWLDAVPYKWKHYFKGLESLEKEGLCFHQAYACAPYTAQTFRAIFSALRPLDDWKESLEKIGCGNSELIRFLRDRNYKICRIGGDTPVYDRRPIEEEFSIAQSVGVSCNTVLWQMLCEMLSSDRPVFLIAHMIVETHPPMLCAELEELKDIYIVRNPLAQLEISANYADQRVMYYQRALRGKQRVQIFMSDHGEHITSEFPEWHWAQRKLHACCLVVGEGVRPGKENRVFSYLKFMDLIRWLVDPEKHVYENCLSDYAVFQDTDIYSEEMVGRFLKRGWAERALAYRGALDGMYKYAINGNEREFFYKIVDDKDVEIEMSEAPERFERLKALAGTQFPDLSSCEKFKFVPEIYKALHMQGGMRK